VHLTRKLTVAIAAVISILGPASPALAADDPAATGACTDPAGVTVVVDFTDVGGEVEIGCATAAATGTEALQEAGFVDTRDASGLICAISANPDPCPAEFTGSYWSYWYAAPGGEWQAYQEGSDTAAPAPGSVEGWRYSDGSVGPTIVAPTVVPAGTESADATQTAAPSAEPSAEQTMAASTDAPASGEQTSGVGGWVIGALVIVLIAAVVTVLVRRRRSDA